MTAPTVKDIFHAALKTIIGIKGHGTQKWLSTQTGIPISSINGIVVGHSGCSEDRRRKIAAAFWYTYSAFMELGKQQLLSPTQDVFLTADQNQVFTGIPPHPDFPPPTSRPIVMFDDGFVHTLGRLDNLFSVQVQSNLIAGASYYVVIDVSRTALPLIADNAFYVITEGGARPKMAQLCWRGKHVYITDGGQTYQADETLVLRGKVVYVGVTI